MKKRWLANLNRNVFYRTRQLQAIGYASLALNVVLLLTLIWVLGVKG
ncbi:hypothetical protein [Enterococcus innesii]|nr:hypothetical protein [Enterococcus innesii]MEB5950642.1 hypothetical protein [Enterococcus innesii]